MTWQEGLGQGISAAGTSWANTQSVKRTNKFNRRWDKNLLLWDMMKQQNQIQWRANDAKKAGFHPLAAVGISPSSSSISATAGVAPRIDGQDFSRAVSATNTPAEKKLTELAISIKEAELKRMGLVNSSLERDLRDSKSNPPIPELDEAYSLGIIKGQGNSTQGVNLIPVEQTLSRSVGKEAGMKPQQSESINKHGTVYDTLQKDLGDTMESDHVSNAKYAIGRLIDVWKNYNIARQPLHVKSMFANSIRHLRPTADPGYEYRWNFAREAFVLRRKNGTSRFFDKKRFGKVPYNNKRSKPVRGISKYRPTPLRR